MQNEIIKKDCIDKTEARRDIIVKSLLEDIETAKNDMETARINFNRVYTPEDVDIYIYKLRSAESRYIKLIKKLKALS